MAKDTTTAQAMAKLRFMGASSGTVGGEPILDGSRENKKFCFAI